MQEIKIDMIGLEALQAALAGVDHALLRGVVGQYLADDEEALAGAGGGARDDLLGGAVAVHLGGVDEGHAEFDAELQGGLLVGGAAALLAHMPSAQAKGRYALAIGEGHAGRGGVGHRWSPVRAPSPGGSRRRKRRRAAP